MYMDISLIAHSSIWLSVFLEVFPHPGTGRYVKCWHAELDIFLERKNRKPRVKWNSVLVHILSVFYGPDCSLMLAKRGHKSPTTSYSYNKFCLELQKIDLVISLFNMSPKHIHSSLSFQMALSFEKSVNLCTVCHHISFN